MLTIALQNMRQHWLCSCRWQLYMHFCHRCNQWNKSSKWVEHGKRRRGLKHLSLAATSAFDSTKRRVTSRWPPLAEECSGVCRLKTKAKNQRNSKIKWPERGRSRVFRRRHHIRVVLQQQAAGFKVTIVFSEMMQWSPVTEEKQKN